MTLRPLRCASVLEDVRVIELGRVVAAPHCGLLLAAAGADVIKVERTGEGDDTRNNAELYPSGVSAYFVQQNWGKRSIALDLAQPAAKDVFWSLLATADVFIENLRPGAIGRLGFGWAAVAERCPRLVMCSISGYGQAGEPSRRPGYGALAEARAGLYEMTGTPAGPPMSGPIPIADMLAASRAFGMICAALAQRARTGAGDYLDVALLDTTVEVQDWALERFTASDGRSRPTRRGLQDDMLVPWGQFATADGWVVLIVSADRFWPPLARLIGRPDLMRDTEFATNAGRARRQEEIYAALAEWCRDQTTSGALAGLQEADVPAEKVASVADVLADQHLVEREMFGTLPSSGGRPVLGAALNFASGRHKYARDAPGLGQHTAEILTELGYGPSNWPNLLHLAMPQAPHRPRPPPPALARGTL